MSGTSSFQALEFERIVVELLVANGFKVEPPPLSFPGNLDADLLAVKGTEEWAIEVKHYRTERAQYSLIETAATVILSSPAVQHGGRQPMLVMSCSLTPELRAAFETKFGLDLRDRSDLRDWAAADPVLLDRLDALLETRTVDVEPRKVEEPGVRPTLKLFARPRPKPPPKVGTELGDELKALRKGKATWAAYEALGDRILKYLFPNDLDGWHRQKRTDDGLNRYDSVCRIKPSTSFWQFLIDHLDSRYVIFEFKNYAKRIGQSQILTTEKYLLSRALRRTAVIFSRLGADKHAHAMAQGAMREHGKLLLVLDDENVLEMLRMKDRGEDASDLLFEIADKFLLSLPR